jgi:hypothetical protein
MFNVLTIVSISSNVKYPCFRNSTSCSKRLAMIVITKDKVTSGSVRFLQVSKHKDDVMERNICTCKNEFYYHQIERDKGNNDMTWKVMTIHESSPKSYVQFNLNVELSSNTLP